MSEPKKRIFIGLIVFTVFLITAITVGLYLIPYIGLRNIHPLAPEIVCFTMGAALGLLILGVGLLILTLVRGREIFLRCAAPGDRDRGALPDHDRGGQAPRHFEGKDPAVLCGGEQPPRLAKCGDNKPKRILLLMPHCLQFNDCAIKITSDANKCQACGKCKIKDLVVLAQEI